MTVNQVVPEPLDDRMFRACVIMEALAFLRSGDAKPDKEFLTQMVMARNAFAGYVKVLVTRFPTAIVIAFNGGVCLRFKVREIERTPLGVLERVEFGAHAANVWSLAK